jgi:signal recognition particle subunit SRP54
MSTCYTLDDFLNTLAQIAHLRGRRGAVQLLPGVRYVWPRSADQSLDRDLARVRGIIHSMTSPERRDPGRLIDASRCRRIAAGAGVSARDVQQFVKQFEVMAQMLARQADGAT